MALDCPDVGEIDIRDLGAQTFREIRWVAPSAGAQTSAELTDAAALAVAAYDLYDAAAEGAAPLARLPAGLTPVGLIYGNAGRHTERPNLPRRPSAGRSFYGFVADDAATGRRVVAFRGTLQPNEWLRNLQARQAPFPKGTRRLWARAWVHRGFLEIFSSLTLETEGASQPLARALPGLMTTDGAPRDVVMVGHSLGGALAVLAAAEARRQASDATARLTTVTFGAPRVGDAGFAEAASAAGRHVRVCNLPDVVTSVPPSAGRTTYRHVGAVFRVSSFDWAALDNALPRGRQVACWHSVDAYRYMTAPQKPPEGVAVCRAFGR